MPTREETIEKVQSLWRLADHPNTPQHEKAAAIAAAEKLMAKYQIDEIVLHATVGGREDIVQMDIRLTEEGVKFMLKDQRIALIHIIATNTRCRGLITDRFESVDEGGNRIPGGIFYRCTGYKSDVDFVKLFATNLGIDMMMAVLSEPSQHPNYQKQFAEGYVERISERLRAIKRAVEKEASSTGMELVLVGNKEAVDDYYNKQNPDVVTYKMDNRGRFDAAARARGAAAANRADIGQGKMGGRKQRRVGAMTTESEHGTTFPYTGEVGCIFDSHRGVYIYDAIVDMAVEYGMERPEEDEEGGWVEAAIEVAEPWLNKHVAAAGYSFGWFDGDYFYQSDEWWRAEDGDDGEEEPSS